VLDLTAGSGSQSNASYCLRRYGQVFHWDLNETKIASGNLI